MQTGVARKLGMERLLNEEEAGAELLVFGIEREKWEATRAVDRARM